MRSVHTEQSVQQAEWRKNESVRSEAKDQVTISSQAQEALKLREVVSNSADIRAEKVREIKEAIAKGAYDVPAAAIAAKMLGITGDK